MYFYYWSANFTPALAPYLPENIPGYSPWAWSRDEHLTKKSRRTVIMVPSDYYIIYIPLFLYINLEKRWKKLEMRPKTNKARDNPSTWAATLALPPPSSSYTSPLPTPLSLSLPPSESSWINPAPTILSFQSNRRVFDGLMWRERKPRTRKAKCSGKFRCFITLEVIIWNKKIRFCPFHFTPEGYFSVSLSLSGSRLVLPICDRVEFGSLYCPFAGKPGPFPVWEVNRIVSVLTLSLFEDNRLPKKGRGRRGED